MTTQVVRLVVRTVLLAIALRHLGPTGKGTVDVAIGVAGLATLLSLPTGQIVLSVLPTHLAGGDGWAARATLHTAWAAGAASSIVTGGLLVALSGPVEQFYDVDGLREIVTGLGIVTALGALAGPITREALLALRRNRSVVVMDLAQLAAEAAATLYVVLADRGALAYATLTAAAPLASYAYSWYRWLGLRGQLRGSADGRRMHDLARSTLRFSAVVAAGTALNVVHLRMPVLVAAALVSPAQLALFNMALSVAIMVSGVVGVSEGVLLSSASSAHLESPATAGRLLERAWRGMLLYGVAASSVMIAFAEDIARLLGGDAFAGASTLIAIAALLPVVTAPDTLRLAFYVLRRPQVTVRLFGVLVAAEAVVYLPAYAAGGLRGVIASRVVGRFCFAQAVARRALERLLATDARHRSRACVRSVATALVVLGCEAALLAALRQAVEGGVLRLLLQGVLAAVTLAIAAVFAGIVPAAVSEQPPTMQE